jgi:hypothetical protein
LKTAARELRHFNQQSKINNRQLKIENRRSAFNGTQSEFMLGPRLKPGVYNRRLPKRGPWEYPKRGIQTEPPPRTLSE